jgi:diguanylate cyclase (GGDEF)-like protein
MLTATVFAALLPVLLAGVLLLRDASLGAQRLAEAQLRSRAVSLAQGLEARLAAANTLATAVVAAQPHPTAAALQAAVATSGMFNRVIVDNAVGDVAGGVGALAAAREPSRVFIAVPVAAGATAYFLLTPEWLWRDVETTDGELAVFDAGGKLLRGTAKTSIELTNMLLVQANAISESAAPRAVGWHADGSEWHGVVAPLTVSDNVNRAATWHVIKFRRSTGLPVGTGDLMMALLLIVALGVVMAAWLAARASGRHLLPLVDLHGALRRLGTQPFTPLPGVDADEVSDVVGAFNDAGRRLDARLRALETLSEIDQLLLSATDLEPALDAILARVHAVTRCTTVGIALLDRDSPHLGRVIVAANGCAALPVSRVEFDPDMHEHLQQSGEALTIARCEEMRHSFLAPLREHGAEFFWVWPVHANSRLAAVLAVGFTEAPAPDPTLAENGAKFAARLAFAVSKTARDEHLYRQAHFDALTALPNRLLFRDRLAQELANANETRARGALLYIDLDHFKKVNDSVGHAAGDQLLTIVAQRLRASVKEGDTVARLGGDEFTVILRNVADPEGASLVAERIVEALNMPVNIAGRDHFVAASIGMTLFPDDGKTIEELMHNADSAMYRAKDLGRGRAVFFDRALMLSRLNTTQSGLYRALRRREFSLLYQPQFNVEDGSLAGLEALLRWNTPRDGTRQPNEFIPAAEASGLIVDIGGWVLEAACAQLALWREQGIAPGRMSINVSAQQLKFVEFPRNVRRTLDKYGIPPEMLEIEITESVFADEAAGQAMVQLAATGVRLALDDFGTGYSSLNYLRRYPIQVVKIDRSFIEDISVNATSGTLAATIITMAHALGKVVVAEGVETEAQMNFLRERRCDLAQGFYLAHPQPATSITEMLQSRRSRLEPDNEAIRQTG